MSYLVLARKYRPKNFKDVIGQSHVTKTLINSFKNGRLSHAYLFAGPRGVGKTSTARILAKSFNCKNNFLGEPCNECINCNEIANGSTLDVLEIDGASNRGVDEIRNLREIVKYPPMNSKFKVIIIDEIHMLTQIAFNALLKTLEEPPEHIKFIFATTEANKILQTIISRCQRYDFNRIGINEMQIVLEKISILEKIEIEKSIFPIISNLADGSMRDALSIFDQLIAFADEKITYELAIKMLGVIPIDLFFKITDSFYSKNRDDLLLTIKHVFNKGYKLNDLISGLNHHILNLLSSKLDSYKEILDMSDENKVRYFNESKKWNYTDLITISEQFFSIEIDFKIVNNPKVFIELNFLKIIEINNKISNNQVINNSSDFNSEKIIEDPKKLEDNNQSNIIKNKTENHNPEPALVIDEINIEKENFVSEKIILSTEELKIDEVIENWSEINKKIEIESKSIAAFLSHSSPHSVINNILKISLPKKYSFQIDVLNNNKQKILNFIKTDINKNFNIEFILDNNSNVKRNEDELSPISKHMIEKFSGEIEE